MTRWCASRRISPRAIRSSTGRAISAISTAIRRAAYRYTEARMTEVARSLLEGIDEDAIDFIATIIPATRRSRWCCRRRCPICSPMARRASRSAWRRRSRRIISPNSATRRSISSPIRKATAEQLLHLRAGAGFSDRRHHRRQARRDHRDLSHRARLVPRARALDRRRSCRAAAWVIVVTEIPYGVQKSRLIEKLAELISEKKLPLVADVRDESAEDVRIVFEPRARTVDPALMMETLFKLSELETRFPMNMNVLVDGVTPRVVSLDEALRQWLDHRRDRAAAPLAPSPRRDRAPHRAISQAWSSSSSISMR